MSSSSSRVARLSSLVSTLEAEVEFWSVVAREARGGVLARVPGAARSLRRAESVLLENRRDLARFRAALAAAVAVPAVPSVLVLPESARPAVADFVFGSFRGWSDSDILEELRSPAWASGAGAAFLALRSALRSVVPAPVPLAFVLDFLGACWPASVSDSEILAAGDESFVVARRAVLAAF